VLKKFSENNIIDLEGDRIMDDLLLALQNVSQQLIPIPGAVALVFLCILLRKIVALVEGITATVKGLDPTLRLVDKSIEKVQAPLDTVVKYSHTLDKVHDKTAETFGKAVDFASDNIDNLKEFVADKLPKEETESAAGEE
jgi:hypothetical protein